MRHALCLALLIATLSNAAVAEQPPLQVYFADLHSHTSYSDGKQKPADAHKYARDVAKLDVFVLTDHLESVDDTEWADTTAVVASANEDSAFVTLPGLEWTKKWGHVNIFGPETRIWPNDPTEFYQACVDAGVVAKFNHPGDGTKSHGGLAYSEIGDKAVQMIELRSPKEEPAYIRALANGWHVAPDGSGDTHSPNWGNGRTWTAILAPSLSQQRIWDALMNRRCYSTQDRNCRLSFTVNGAQMGSVVTEPATTVKVTVKVDEPDEGDAIAKIELFEDGEIVETDEPKRHARCWQVTRIPEPGKHYYFAKVTMADGNLLWLAPAWVTLKGK